MLLNGNQSHGSRRNGSSRKCKEGGGEVSGKEEVPRTHICARESFGELKQCHKSSALTVMVSQLESQGPLSHTGHFSLPGRNTVKMGGSLKRGASEKREKRQVQKAEQMFSLS